MLIVTVNVLKLAEEDALVLVSALLTSLLQSIGTQILAVYISAHLGITHLLTHLPFIFFQKLSRMAVEAFLHLSKYYIC